MRERASLSAWEIMLAHQDLMKNDPQRLQIDFVKELVGTRKYAWNKPLGKREKFERVKKQKTRPKTAVHHKGYQSQFDWTRLNSLVKKGKASWWRPLRTLDEALATAGI